jgi:DNA (cytosine-5)-methyltransferase 1
VGGVASGPPAWLDGYWDVEPDIPRTARGVKDRVKRLKALGNCVVPAQAYPVFRAIAEIETEERYES